MEVKELISELERKCKSSNGFMGVNFSEVKSQSDLFENVKDEILSISETIEHSDIEEEFGMSVREARGYIKKLNNFIARHDLES